MSTMSETTSNRFLPLSEPCLQGNEWQYVRECLDSGWISSVGEFVNRFEQRVAEYVGVKYAVATVNGTSALHTALLVAGVLPDDEVLVSTLTFIATANSIRYAGAHPVMIDCEPRWWQMDPQLVEDFLRNQCRVVNGELFNRATGRRVSAIMPVHVLGHPVNLDAIEALAKEFGLRLVEDAAESLGASWQNRRIGNSTDIACVSFNGNKTITCGGGGMLLTNSRKDADRARYLTTQAKDDAVEYIHHEVGFNYRMTNVLAAIGLAQLEQLDGFVERRRSIADCYRSQLSLPGMTWHADAPGAYSTSWLATVLIDPFQAGITAIQLRDQLQQQRIQTRRLWQPMHSSPAHANCQAIVNGTADRLFAQALSFPSTPNLQAEDLQRVVGSVLSLLPGIAQVPVRRAA